jgi:2-methylcitrate dehydratase PrpD
MTTINRRGFLAASALAVPLAEAAPFQNPAPADPEVTRILARYLVGARREDTPAAVRQEAARTLLNWVGCAVGGSRHETVDAAVAALSPFSGPAQATLLGRKERLDVLHTALMNGISSHIFDFDDTHLRTIVHPAGPVASAILALSEYRPVSGADFLHALILGVETECRIANSVYPEHYDIGWHITGTVGPFGAAAAAGKLLGLSETQMVWALGVAAVQPVGLQEMFGTMTKSFHPGRAAQNGLTAAFLASRNFTSSVHGIEAPRGWARVVSTGHRFDEITAGLGDHFEISNNSYKPFPCGIVIHPALDACLQLRALANFDPAQVDRVELRVHPLVLTLTGKKTPQSGLDSKFSVYHAVAAALVYGRVGEAQFSDRAAHDPSIIALRDRIATVVDPAIAQDQVRVTVTLKGGRQLEKYIEHAVGSVKNPMTDAQLEAKFSGLADGILAGDRVRALLDLCWNVEKLPKAAQIATSAAG